MGRAERAIGDAAADPDNYHRQPGQADIVTNLLKSPHHDKRNDGIHQRPETGQRESRGDTDHVLFTDPGIDKLLRMTLPEPVENDCSDIAGQQDDAVVAYRRFLERGNEGVSHAPCSSSCNARAYSSADGQR